MKVDLVGKLLSQEPEVTLTNPAALTAFIPHEASGSVNSKLYNVKYTINTADRGFCNGSVTIAYTKAQTEWVLANTVAATTLNCPAYEANVKAQQDAYNLAAQKHNYEYQKQTNKLDYDLCSADKEQINLLL